MLLYAESYFYGKLWLPEELIHPSGCTAMSKRWWAGTEICVRVEAMYINYPWIVLFFPNNL